MDPLEEAIGASWQGGVSAREVLPPVEGGAAMLTGKATAGGRPMRG